MRPLCRVPLLQLLLLLLITCQLASPTPIFNRGALVQRGRLFLNWTRWSCGCMCVCVCFAGKRKIEGLSVEAISSGCIVDVKCFSSCQAKIILHSYGKNRTLDRVARFNAKRASSEWGSSGSWKSIVKESQLGVGSRLLEFAGPYTFANSCRYIRSLF